MDGPIHAYRAPLLISLRLFVVTCCELRGFISYRLLSIEIDVMFSLNHVTNLLTTSYCWSARHNEYNYIQFLRFFDNNHGLAVYGEGQTIVLYANFLYQLSRPNLIQFVFHTTKRDPWGFTFIASEDNPSFNRRVASFDLIDVSSQPVAMAIRKYRYRLLFSNDVMPPKWGMTRRMILEYVGHPLESR